MIVLEFLFRLIGGFYLLAGLIGTRRIVMDATIDHAIAMISLKPTPATETTKRRLLVVGIVLIGMAGMALAVMSLWAVPIFALTTASHLHLMAWLSRNEPPQDQGAAADRMRSLRSTLAFAAIGAGVLFLASRGSLAPLDEPWRAGAIAIAGIVLAAMIARGLMRTGKRRQFGDFGGHDGPYEDEQVDGPVEFDPDEPLQYEFRASADGLPLFEHVHDTPTDHDLILSPDLAVRLTIWNAAVVALRGDAVPEAHELPETLLDEARLLLAEMEAEIGQTIACRYRPGAMEWARQRDTQA